jgi:hypothetical protein
MRIRERARTLGLASLLVASTLMLPATHAFAEPRSGGGGGGCVYFNQQTGEREVHEPGDVVLVTNRDGHVTWLVCEPNGTWYRMSGFSTSDTTTAPYPF